MIRYNYNRQVFPAAPFIHVHLSNPAGNRELRDQPAQVDSGADFTVIPQHAVEELQLLPIREITVAGFAGMVSAITYAIRATPRQLKPVMVEAVASDGEPHILLGRDFLNHFRVVLDGPGLVLELE